MGCGASAVQDSSTGRMTFACNCGKVEWKTRESFPREHYECACQDCTERVSWAVSQGAEAHDLATPHGPSWNVVVGNSFSAVTGKDHIKVCKVRQDSKTTIFYATCCHSLLFMIHPSHGPSLTGISINTAKFSAEGGYELWQQDQICRWHAGSSQWDKRMDEKALPLPPFQGKGPEFLKAELSFGAKGSVVCKHIKNMGLKPLKEEGDFTIQDILAELCPDGQLEILGI